MQPNSLTVARTLAPDDIQSGMYVSTLYEHESLIPFYHVDNLFDLKNIEPFHWRTLPKKTRPLKVIDVCAPFVLTERPSGKHELIDIRKTSLAGLSESFGKETFKRLMPKKKDRGSKDEQNRDSRKSKRSWKRLWRRERDAD